MRRRAVVVVCVAACGSSHPVTPPAKTQSSAAVVRPIVAATVDAGGGTPVAPLDASTLATRVYAEVAAGRNDAARALVRDRPSACGAEVNARARSDGGFLVHGGSVVVRVDGQGAFESYALATGCVAYADDTVQVVDTEAGRAIIGATPQPEVVSGDSVVETNGEWVLLAAHDGAYVAWPRGTASVLRGTSDEAGDGGEPTELRARLAGRYVITSRPNTLHRRDGSATGVTGCKGEVVSVASTPGGIALQVRAGRTADTALCFVTDRGATAHVTQLGHAICGLASAMPCDWQLAATTSRLLVYAGMRGGVVVVDATTGRKLTYRGEPSAQFPAAYSACGDEVCVSTSNEGAGANGIMELGRGGVRYRVRPTPKPNPSVQAAASVAAAWCVDGDLLVPCG